MAADMCQVIIDSSCTQENLECHHDKVGQICISAFRNKQRPLKAFKLHLTLQFYWSTPEEVIPLDPQILGFAG